MAPGDSPRLDARKHASAVDNNPGGQLDMTGGARWNKFDLMVSAASELKDRAGLRIPEPSLAVTTMRFVVERIELLARARSGSATNR